MGAKTGIEWTDATWNPIIGCSRVSEGCRNCYAEAMAGRFRIRADGKETVYSGLTEYVNGHTVWTGQIKETRQLLQPLSWRNPKRVFVNSMSDLFHENVTDEQRDRIFAVMALCSQHTFQVLTKRPEGMLKYLSQVENERDMQRLVNAAIELNVPSPMLEAAIDEWIWPLPNIWLGVSVENQAAADERIPLLLETPAVVRFISAEPLLGPVTLNCPVPNGYLSMNRIVVGGNPLRALPALDWVICGGESGPGARPMHPDWARSLRDQCAAAGVPFFFKQWGEYIPASHNGGEGDAPERVGKKAAGALLCGVEHKDFPAVQP